VFQQFINRKDELDFLNKKYSSSSPEFIVLYGRRRVGKTELIKQFIKNKPAVYFLADRQIDRENLRQMQRSMAIYLSEPLFEMGRDTCKHEHIPDHLRLIHIHDGNPDGIQESAIWAKDRAVDGGDVEVRGCHEVSPPL
jgi:AAA+ ATPase superfamily predicted ATPase